MRKEISLNYSQPNEMDVKFYISSTTSLTKVEKRLNN